MIKINKLAGRWQSFIIGTVGLIGVLVTGGNEAIFAQVIPDDTLGAESSVVTPDVLIREILSDRIDGGATRGANLFHSFLEFNIAEGRGVYFANPDGIENILSRVTGDNVSTILGRLGVLGEANLFLLNPNGILFGENASLDIEGSFVATTASGIELGEDGVFSATQPKSSRLLSVSPGALFYNAVEAAGGKITNRGNLTTGRNLTLDGENLELQGQLGSGRDLTLLAQDTVTIRDSETNPFIADAGGNLLVQGNQGIDIFALNHPDSGLFSGGDMVLRSAADVGGDAHYWSGGSFRIEQLDGNLGNLSSPDDPIIRARGDVFMNSYQGASLHILAGGKVEIRWYVWIQSADPENGLVETVKLADGTTISIDGKNEPTLDIRAGVNPDVIGRPILSGSFPQPPDVTLIPSSADIKIGTILFTSANNTSVPLTGRVLLTNQYQPNSSLSGDIQVTNTQQGGPWGAIFTNGGAGNPSVAINSRGGITLKGTVRTSSSFGDGGAIALTAFDNITTGDLNSFSRGFGNGGTISVISTNGSIDTEGLFSDSWSNSGNAGNGGVISLEAANGSITTGNLNSSSYSDTGIAGNGGTIRLEANNGSVSTGFLASNSRSYSDGSGGNGGDISLEATDDININGFLYSYSSNRGTTGNGGDISLSAANNITITNGLYSYSWSDSGNAGNGGDISLSAANDITIDDHAYAYSLSFDGTAANGGKISLVTANGNVSTGSLSSDSRSSSSSAANGGAINISATNGSISSTGYLLSASNSYFGVGGNGGAITLEAANDITIARDVNALSNSSYGNAGDGGTIRIDAGNNINIADSVNSFSSSESGNAGNGRAIRIEAGNDITIKGNVYSYSDSNDGNAGDGGAIHLEAANGINVRGILESYSHSDYGNTANGGSIRLLATNGDITTNGFNSSSNSEEGLAGNGSEISLKAPNGNISTMFLSSYSNSLSAGSGGNGGTINLEAGNSINIDSARSFSSNDANAGQAGKGGTINLEATEDINIADRLESYSRSVGGIAVNGGTIHVSSSNGNIATGYIDSSSLSFFRAGNGGDISLIARGGDIIGDSSNSFLYSYSFALPEGEAGSGGNVTLEAQNNLTNLEILTPSPTSSGDVVINGFDNLSVTNTRILTSKLVKVDVDVEVPFPTTPIILDVGGQGQSGDVTVTSSGNLTFNNSSIESDTHGSGRAGNVTVSSLGLITFNNSQIISNTSNIGDAGDIEINAGKGITFQGVYSYFDQPQRGGLFAGTTNEGFAGNITLTTPELTLQNGTNIATTTESIGAAGEIILQSHPNGEKLNINFDQDTSISASTFNQADGGNLRIIAPNTITIQGEGTITTETTGAGTAGNLTFDTQRLTIADGATISASTDSANPSGVGGNLTINATESFNLTNQASLLAQSTGAAKAGNVTINTEQLTANNGSITTSARATSLGEGGSIDVNASQINLKGTEIGLLAETEGVAPAGALTLQPFANGQNLTINLQDNAKISAATSGSGEGGSLSVTAPESITIRGQGQLSVETTGDGAAGNLTIDTQNLTITDGATISASTASPNPQGLGGNLTINATESFTLTNQARILAQSTGAAPAGTITVDTGQLTANNGSIETSATQSAGGAITITASDIRLFGDSDIRTDVASGVGGGGNITLTADTILAFADSDILAFAQDGKGGDITFNTPVFFGFAYAPAPKGTDPDTLDHNGRVDINATGAVEGVITLPDTSAVRNSLTPLSNNQIDTDKLIAESCIARRHEPKRGSFFITGTGGIPFRPGDLYVTPYQTGTVRSIPSQGDGEASRDVPMERLGDREESSSTRRPWKIGDPIIEPTGIYRLANGELIMGRLCGE